MKKFTTRSWGVSYGRDGYRLHLDEVSAWADMAETLAFFLCEATGQHLCRLLCGRAAIARSRSEEQVYSLELTKDQAREVSPDLVDLFEEDE